MNKEIMNSVISLANGEKYVMISSADYQGKTYYLANEVVDNHLGEEMAIFRAETVDGNTSLVMEPDMNICGELIKIFDAQNQEVA